MPEELELKEESALNLTLEGSVGTFKVGTGRKGQNSLEVKYFLTHVGLDFSGGSSEALLSHLSPVREIFSFKDLAIPRGVGLPIPDTSTLTFFINNYLILFLNLC